LTITAARVGDGEELAAAGAEAGEEEDPGSSKRAASVIVLRTLQAAGQPDRITVATACASTRLRRIRLAKSTC
jgi:hypothetical protein